MSKEELHDEAPEVVLGETRDEVPAGLAAARVAAQRAYNAADTARRVADARVLERERAALEAEALYQRVRSDDAWSQVERARAELERAKTDKRLAHEEATRAFEEAEKARAAHEAEQRARDEATRAGRLEVLSRQLTLEASARAVGPAVGRYVEAMLAASAAHLELVQLAHRRAAETAEATSLAAQLKAPPPPRLRTNLEFYLAARALHERLPAHLRGVAVGGPVPPARHSAWEESESAAEAAVVHALATGAR